MREKIKEINNLMKDFYDHWEKENTNEMFLLLSGDNNTSEIELNIKKNNVRLDKIEEIFNSEENFEAIVELWNSIDLKLFDSLVYSFEINIDQFKERLKESKAKKEIKEFFKEL